MNYSFLWTDRNRKYLEKLPAPRSKRIVDIIESISEDPHRMAERCEGYSYYHQRIGSHRAILEIDDSKLLISVIKIGPRKKVYDR